MVHHSESNDSPWLWLGALQFIYDAWYAYLTPDREFPREVRGMLNRAFGELAHAARALDLRQLLLGYPPTLRLPDTAAGLAIFEAGPQSPRAGTGARTAMPRKKK